MIPLYKNIRKRRIELGLSQQKLADRLGYKSRSAINKIELGVNDLTQSKIIAFAKALNTTPGELMGLEDHSYSTQGNCKSFDAKYPAPNITEDYVTFPVTGEIAAGYGVSPEWVKRFKETQTQDKAKQDLAKTDRNTTQFIKEQQDLISACSKLSVEDLKKVLEYVEFIKSKRND